MTTREDIFSIPPRSFDIDICGFCNLSCRYCPEGQKLNQQPLKFMSFGDFVEIFRQLPKELTNIGLTNWSEPFLNKDIIKIIEYVKVRGNAIIIFSDYFFSNSLQGETEPAEYKRSVLTAR